MRTLLILLLIPMMAAAQSQPVPLPASFSTTKGTTIQGGKVFGKTATHVTILHDAGMAKIPHEELPNEVRALLGLRPQAAASQEVTLPDPLVIGYTQYAKPRLNGIDPDGIRITHDLGSAKIPYEQLPAEVVALVGPFDPAKAAAARQAAQDQALQARLAAQAQAQAQAAAQVAQAQAAAANESSGAPAMDDHTAALVADPNLLSPSVFVELDARSSGGKSREVTYRSRSGSEEFTDTSNRTMTCFVKSRSESSQRLRLQCLWLTRSVTGEMVVDVVADGTVTLGPGGKQTVVASGTAVKTDGTYVSLGLQIRTGGKYVAWSWRAIDGQGRITAVRSSTRAYDHYALETPL